tara:strand:+ start:1321 stop:2067 length:747 start_codon:yes stop_codon:yes gene_type:complete
MRILVTRHALAAEKLKKILRADGFDVQCEPLLEIKFDIKTFSLEGVQALVVTSSSGVVALAGGTHNRELPVFAVGNATAAALNIEGFKDVRTASGNSATLTKLILDVLSPAEGSLVHVTGQHVAGDLLETLLAKGFSIRRVVSYRAETPNDLSADAKKSLRKHKIDVVLFFSPRTATIFANLVEKARLKDNIAMLSAACLSEEVARPIRNLGWHKIVVAKTSEQQALVQKLYELREEIKGTPWLRTAK